LLFVVDVTGKQDCGSSALDSELPESPDCGLPRVLEQCCDFRRKVVEDFTDLKIGRMN
jgi:hypothetical protein